MEIKYLTEKAKVRLSGRFARSLAGFSVSPSIHWKSLSSCRSANLIIHSFLLIFLIFWGGNQVWAQGSNQNNFGGNGSGGGLSNQTALGIPLAATATTSTSSTTPGANQGVYQVVRSNTTQGTANTATETQVGDCSSPGTITGASTTYTVLYSDVVACVVRHDLSASGAATITIPTPAALNNPNPIFSYENDSAQSDTLSPTTYTISLGNAAAAATLSVPSNTVCLVNLDRTNASTWKANCHPISTSGVCAGCVVNNGTNAATSAMTLDLSASTVANAFKVPVGAGLTSGADGVVGYDSTNKNTHIRGNGADALAVFESSAIGTQVIPKSSSASLSQLTNSSITDNGTTVTSTEIIHGNNTSLLSANSSAITATNPGTSVLTITLPVNKNTAFHCSGTYSQATAAAANGISVQCATNACTRLDAWAKMDVSNPTSTNYTGSAGSVANLTTTTATNVISSATPGATGTNYQWNVEGVAQAGASAPTLTILFFTGNASDAVTVNAGSYCTAMP